MIDPTYSTLISAFKSNFVFFWKKIPFPDVDFKYQRITIDNFHTSFSRSMHKLAYNIDCIGYIRGIV